MCRSRRELSNEYLLAKIGVDTPENEPLEVWGENSIQYSLNSLRGPAPVSVDGLPECAHVAMPVQRRRTGFEELLLLDAHGPVQVNRGQPGADGVSVLPLEEVQELGLCSP